MQLWEQGLFELDDDINGYLPPELQVHNPYYPSDSITFRMLLTHTSSINDNWSILNTLVSWGSDSPIPLDTFLVNYLVPGGYYYSALNYNNQQPGTEWDYSNAAITLVGYLVEVLSDTITGITFSQHCQDSIFTPLNMHETSWFLSDLNINNLAVPYDCTI
jgi:CubicO group peptidase (beta-lactamase class C family)